MVPDKTMIHEAVAMTLVRFDYNIINNNNNY